MNALGRRGSQDARDELGLGSVRDTFADAFFPGLSTIQSRARYFLFIQWCCELASQEASESRIIATLRAREVEVINSLIAGKAGSGVIGVDKREDLERMPSEIYWSGLRTLGMRGRPGSISAWARRVVLDRQAAKDAPAADGHPAPSTTGFATDRPEMPALFASGGKLDFKLSREEARYLKARFATATVNRREPVDCYNLMRTFQVHRGQLGFKLQLWEHPRMGHLEPDVRRLVELAKAFSLVMHGATLLYQRRVAALKAQDPGGAMATYDARAAGFADWVGKLDPEMVDRVARDLSLVIPLAAQTRHRIDAAVLAFINQWVERCRLGEALITDEQAELLVSNREMSLKARMGTSRIRSAAARSRWKGDEARPLEYRWGTARTFLNDLASAG